jgi:hypothetical protein
MIFKICSSKNFAKILVLFAQTTASFCKNLRKTPFFSPKIGKNRSKIVIIKSTPGVNSCVS